MRVMKDEERNEIDVGLYLNCWYGFIWIDYCVLWKRI
jgi:hypothetical protein